MYYTSHKCHTCTHFLREMFTKLRKKWFHTKPMSYNTARSYCADHNITRSTRATPDSSSNPHLMEFTLPGGKTTQEMRKPPKSTVPTTSSCHTANHINSRRMIPLHGSVWYLTLFAVHGVNGHLYEPVIEDSLCVRVQMKFTHQIPEHVFMNMQ